MEISNKPVFLLIVTLFAYAYLSQLFNKPSVQSSLLKAFNGTNFIFIYFIYFAIERIKQIISHDFYF